MSALRGLSGGLVGVLLLAPALTGCGPLATKADCVPELKFGGQVYRQVGYTSIHADAAGTAQLAYCEDTGRHPRGSVIDVDSPQIEVYTLTGYGADQVLVYAVSGDLFQVFAANDLSSSQISEIKKSDLLKAG